MPLELIEAIKELEEAIIGAFASGVEQRSTARTGSFGAGGGI